MSANPNAARAAALVRGAFGPELVRNVIVALDEAEARGRGDAMGQAYQIVGQFILALDEPQYRPSEKESERLLDYLSSGRYDDEFLPWPATPADGRGE